MFTIAFSPVMQAFLILFGAGPVHTRTVLAICASRNDAEGLLSQWGSR